ncbi:amidohydrolase family protein [Marinovum sp. 2_MG-2023]|uniref:amidohydrolase family protein n=1 Tax=unclassified Marinovum TaxID=2647166 RepID=UPI0026E33B62|nr:MULTISPECIES: amidohydrolase family protein [unclassified Marinovum]MDO6731837.1 amidohydrolase family protein [Marinovum sp. 2_MG-2023]MDO6781089.1 amidohydrolase family protein [Marinovum sp. 1_MG-2023]
MILDAHQHFWQLSRGDYPWPDESVAQILRDFLPDDLAPHLNANDVAKTILVQATDTVAETEFLLALAEQHAVIAGVVGWVPLDSPDAPDLIDRLRRNPMLKGLRPMLQNIVADDWILRPEVQPALAHMQAIGLCLDALIQPRHLEAIACVAKTYPDLKIVIDHIAKPDMGAGNLPDGNWINGMSALACCPNVFCKFSGMVTEAGPAWSLDQIAPFADHVLNCFGPSKLMWGSDWPVVNLASDYPTWCQTARKLVRHLSEDAQHDVFWRTGTDFYNLSSAG